MEDLLMEGGVDGLNEVFWAFLVVAVVVALLLLLLLFLEKAGKGE